MAASKPIRRNTRTLELLAELKAIAARCGYQVREEKLLHDVGYRPRSGGCRLRGSRLILLDRDAPPSVQLDVLVDILAAESIEHGELSRDAAALLDRARRRLVTGAAA